MYVHLTVLNPPLAIQQCSQFQATLLNAGIALCFPLCRLEILSLLHNWLWLQAAHYLFLSYWYNQIS